MRKLKNNKSSNDKSSLLESTSSNYCTDVLATPMKVLPHSVCVCVCLRPSTVKVSSVWGWNSRGQISDVVLKMFLSSAKSLHCYFSMKHRAFLTSCFILFTHQKRPKSRLNQLYVCLAFKNMGSSSTIIRHRPQSALHREPISLLHQHSREGSQSNQKRPK